MLGLNKSDKTKTKQQQTQFVNLTTNTKQQDDIDFPCTPKNGKLENL